MVRRWRAGGGGHEALFSSPPHSVSTECNKEDRRIVEVFDDVLSRFFSFLLNLFVRTFSNPLK